MKKYNPIVGFILLILGIIEMVLGIQEARAVTICFAVVFILVAVLYLMGMRDQK